MCREEEEEEEEEGDEEETKVRPGLSRLDYLRVSCRSKPTLTLSHARRSARAIAWGEGAFIVWLALTCLVSSNK